MSEWLYFPCAQKELDAYCSIEDPLQHLSQIDVSHFGAQWGDRLGKIEVNKYMFP